MAALTATLIGLALAGGLTAGKTIADKQNAGANAADQSVTPSPVAGPPQTNASASSAQAAASVAAGRQKKRAAAGDTILTGGTKTGTGMPRDFPSAGASPASLIGS